MSRSIWNGSWRKSLWVIKYICTYYNGGKAQWKSKLHSLSLGTQLLSFHTLLLSLYMSQDRNRRQCLDCHKQLTGNKWSLNLSWPYVHLFYAKSQWPLGPITLQLAILPWFDTALTWLLRIMILNMSTNTITIFLTPGTLMTTSSSKQPVVSSASVLPIPPTPLCKYSKFHSECLQPCEFSLSSYAYAYSHVKTPVFFLALSLLIIWFFGCLFLS